MEYLGDKLAVAQTQMSQWVGSMRRSVQDALSAVSTAMTPERGGGASGGGRGFKRAASLRSLAARSRESLRRLSLRSQRRRHADPRSSADTPPSDQLRQCVRRAGGEGKDTDTLVQETDSQYGTWETGLRSEDSLTPASPTADSLSSSLRRQTPSSTFDPTTPSDPDGVDGVSLSLSTPGEQEDIVSFPEPASGLLDCSAQKSRPRLSQRKKHRTLPSRSVHQGGARGGLAVLPEAGGASTDDWLYRDSTEAKPEQSAQEDSDPEDQPRRTDRANASQPPMVPLFPGMDPSALKAQLRKRGEGEGAPDSPSQLSRSPKSPFVPGARVLPPAVGKENGAEEASPQWLKELKSKKRLSQYDMDN